MHPPLLLHLHHAAAVVAVVVVAVTVHVHVLRPCSPLSAVYLCPLLLLSLFRFLSLSLSRARVCVYVYRPVVGAESVTDKLFLSYYIYS